MFQGYCNQCGQRIDENQSIVDKINELTKPLFTNKPIFGAIRIIPLPPYPCGHNYYWKQQCYKLSSDKYKYDV